MKNKLKKNYKLILILFTLVILQFYCIGTSTTPAIEADARPAKWAQPMEREGLPNLNKVSDTLYRGAQFKKEGIPELKKLGIKTIVNFRRSSKDSRLLKGHDFKYINIPIKTFRIKKAQMERFLQIVTDPEYQPVFVHCKHGADRTGAACALYRIKVQNWDVEEAIKEMTGGGYNFHRIHGHLKKFVRNF